MSTSRSKLIEYLSERLHSDKCLWCKSYFDYMLVKDDQLIFRCLECENNYEKDFNKDLIKGVQIYTNFVLKTINLFCY